MQQPMLSGSTRRRSSLTGHQETFVGKSHREGKDRCCCTFFRDFDQHNASAMSRTFLTSFGLAKRTGQ
jgi:hypothetical protein